MIRRIVRMSFQEDKVNDFLKVFNKAKHHIRQMPGCSYLSLHRDNHQSHIYYTLSHWDDQAFLDNYRESELFKSTWKATKQLFNDKPQAYSLEMVDDLG
ncbi:MAG: antibiotic biosynthesis monooxygenase [Cyclobacteriaceae bacterium]